MIICCAVQNPLGISFLTLASNESYFGVPIDYLITFVVSLVTYDFPIKKASFPTESKAFLRVDKSCSLPVHQKRPQVFLQMSERQGPK